MPRAPKNKITRDTSGWKNCETCGKRFERICDFNRHLLSHSDDKPFKCQLCDFTAIQKVGLDTHMNAVHLKEKPHKCYSCEEWFADKSYRYRHMKREHAYKPGDWKYFAQFSEFKAVKRSSTPAPSPELVFQLPGEVRKIESTAPSNYLGAPVAGQYIPRQQGLGFEKQQFGYTFPAQQPLYTFNSDFFAPQSQSYVPAQEYSIPEPHFAPAPKSYLPAQEYNIPDSQSYTTYTPFHEYSTASSQSYSSSSTAASAAQISTPFSVDKSQDFCWDLPAPVYNIPESQSYTGYTPFSNYSISNSQSYSSSGTASSVELATPSSVDKPQDFGWDISTLSDTASQALPHRDLFYNNAMASYPQVHQPEDVKENLSLLQTQPTVEPDFIFDEDFLKWADQSIQDFLPPSAPMTSLPPSSAFDFAQGNSFVDPYLLNFNF